MFEIYDKLFDHLDQTRFKLSRKKVSWKRIILDDLITTNVKFRHYYSKTQDFLKLFIRKNDVVIIKQKKRCISKFELKSETWWNIVKRCLLKSIKKTIRRRILRRIQIVFSTQTNLAYRRFKYLIECRYFFFRRKSKWFAFISQKR